MIVYRANQSELQFLGYSREEYIGRSIVEFHADQAIIKGLFFLTVQLLIIFTQNLRYSGSSYAW